MKTKLSPHRSTARRWLRTVVLITLAATVALILIYAGLLLLLRHRMRTSLAQVDGTVRITGLSNTVTVRRDDHGVPHITATNLDDLLVAQGYVTAQDRLWQMDMARRMSTGRCAEVMGSSCLTVDRTQRILGFQQIANSMWKKTSAEDRQRLESYARGVNAYLSDHTGNLPAEFLLLHYRPDVWKPTDSLLIELSVAQMLDDHWRKLAARATITSRLGSTLAADLYPNGSPEDILPGQLGPEPSPQHETFLAEEKGQANILSARLLANATIWDPAVCDECTAGSNAWVVAGSRTVSGSPMLANDMHLGLQIPNVWYSAELLADSFHVTGVSIPGVPYIAAGKNDNIAWGITAMYGTTQSLVAEETNTNGQYRAPIGWKALQYTHEVIDVRAGRDVTMDVGRTDDGPIITPLLENKTKPIALRWSLLQNMQSLPLFELNKANDWAGFRGALRRWPAPALNLVYADKQGHIGYQAVGTFPLLQRSTVPQQNVVSTHVYVPFDDLPSVYDPPSGIIVTANSTVTPRDYSYDLGHDFPPALRTERITHVLADSARKLTQADSVALQNDTFSRFDRDLAKQIAKAIELCGTKDPQLMQAADLLRRWGGVIRADSSAAAVVAATKAAFWKTLLEQRLGDQWKLYDPPEANTAMELLLQHRKNIWLPRDVSDWDHLLLHIVQRGLHDQHAPRDLTRWRYGATHSIAVRHPIYALIPGTTRWAGPKSEPQSGDLTTVKQVARSFGPSQRFTIDWGDPSHATETLVNGESGNPESPWYNDQWNAWYTGSALLQPGSVAADNYHVLRLVK